MTCYRFVPLFLYLISFGNSQNTAGCKTNSGCNEVLTCHNNVCVDLCASNVCGPNADCKVASHIPVCSCKAGYIHVGTGCQPADQRFNVGCSSNAECRNEMACLSQVCTDPCAVSSCGPNTVCNVVNHIPTCSCQPGFRLTQGGCQQILPATTGRETYILGGNTTMCMCPCGKDSSYCTTNDQCLKNYACMNHKCTDPCSMCGKNTVCTIKNHIPACACKPGYIGNAIKGCNKDKFKKKPMKDKEYWIGPGQLNFTEAINACYSRGMVLGTVLNLQEQKKLEKAIKSSGKEKKARVWIGGYFFENYLIWITSGKVASFTYWQIDPNYREPVPYCVPPRGPSRCNKCNCVVASQCSKWQMPFCGEAYSYACEYFKDN